MPFEVGTWSVKVVIALRESGESVSVTGDEHSGARYVRGRGVCLSRDEELCSSVGVPKQRDERGASVQRNLGYAGTGVANPVGLAEGGGRAKEQALTLQLVELV